jgi:hypothetical protein
MVPMRFSTIFKSRWFAVVWAAGIIWMAYDVAGGRSETTNNSASAEQATDVTGAPVNPDDAKTLEEAIKNL